MKIYEWSFKGRKGTVNADNTKDAKVLVAGLLRNKSDTSTRIPKGTKIKKIGLITEKDLKATEKAKEETLEPLIHTNVKQVHSTQIPELNYEPLSKDTKFTNCIIQFKDGSQTYIADGCEMIIVKGTACCKKVTWGGTKL